MGKLVYVTGGARSGKSRFAEAIAAKYRQVCYIATAVACDDEMEARIARHRAERPGHWHTVEAYTGLGEVLRGCKEDAALIDCLTIGVSNIMMQCGCDNWDELTQQQADDMEKVVLDELTAWLQGARDASCDVIIVSNELGMGLVPPNPLGRAYRDIIGRANAQVAACADEAFLLVSGIPVKLK